MPFAVRETVRLNWRADGPEDRPALLLLSSLGTDLSMWDGVMPAFAGEFRVIRMDARGHGASDAPPGDYAIADLAADALAVLDAAGIRHAHVCGLSMGGMIALELALVAPGRVGKVVACNTSAAVVPEPWQARAATVREAGMAAIADAVMNRFFSPPFRERAPDVVAAARASFVANRPDGYAACCMAISRLDLLPRLGGVAAPVLVVNGTLDEATPPADHGDRIVAAIGGARVANLAAGHLSAVEEPAAFASAVGDFLRD